MGALAACGAAPTNDADNLPSRGALERVELLARTGTGHEWQQASAEEKRAFTLAAVVGLEFDRHSSREELALDLRVCIDAAAASTPEDALAELATYCANQVRRNGVNALSPR